MKGGQVAYDLRPNKFVERQLFVELLAKVCTDSPDEYVYVSLGGPQLEDQRLVHQRLGFKKLVSLEADSSIHKRQLFNRRPSYIECRNESSDEFVDDFDAFMDSYDNEKFVIWLDYSQANARRKQVIEYETLFNRLTDGDLIKITLNANPDTLAQKRSEESPDDVQKKQLEELRKQLDDYLPRNLEHTKMTEHDILPILSGAIEHASLNAVRDDLGSQPVPLGSFAYADGYHQMLTITVRRTRKTEVKSFCENLKSHEWEYLPSEWKDVTRIDVPHLTVIERLYIEKMLFSDDHCIIHKNLPFSFHRDPQQSLKILEEYAAHYRRYPTYIPVVF